MLVLLLMTIVGMGMPAATTQSVFLARLQKNRSYAFNSAESGAEAALLYLANEVAGGSETSARMLLAAKAGRLKRPPSPAGRPAPAPR